MEAAEKISKITGCKIDVSTNNEDNRNYKVSAEKIRQVGFNPTKKIENAIEEISKAISDGTIKDYKDDKYSNYKLLFSSKEMQERVFIQGINGSLDLP